MNKQKLTALTTAAVILTSASCTPLPMKWLTPPALTAAALSYGDFDYSVNEDDLSITITQYNGTGGDVIIPDEIDGMPVTLIGRSAFQGNTTLTGITIPDGVTSIGVQAFFKCSNLTSVSIPDSVNSIQFKAFGNCKNLTNINMPASLTSIGECAFLECRSLTDITLPEGVTYIGWQAFAMCRNLTSINIPNSLTELEDAIFSECVSLTGITIPDSVTELGAGAFYTCYNLKSIVIPDSVTTIGIGAFEKCSALTSVTLSNSLTEIKFSVFSGCSSLKQIIIPAGVAKISSSAFKYCDSLTDIYILNPACAFYNEQDAIPPATVIHGYIGSTAQAYAETNDHTFEALDHSALITAQPQDISASIGDKAIFTVAAQGQIKSYQWQYYNKATSQWENTKLAGNKTASLTVPVTSGRNKMSYRCVITDSKNHVLISAFATLTVCTHISAQPQNTSATVGDKVQFTVDATGVGLTYLWQYYIPATKTWANSGLTGHKTAALTVTSLASRNNMQYRCVIIDANGAKTITDVATLTVTPKITAQPKSVSAASGEKVKFSVSASGAGLIYQWQYYNTEQKKWMNTGLTGNKTAELTVTAYNSRNGMRYKCIVKDANGIRISSNPATLTVK